MCDPGYVIVGNNTRECLFDGSWSAGDPQCVYENLDVIIAAVVPSSIVILLIGLVLVLLGVVYHRMKKPPTMSYDLDIIECSSYER